MIPRFMVIGAGKSGTSSLTAYLNQHPDVCLTSPKEPWFFDNDDYYKGLDYYYTKYYPHCKEHQICGEGSTTYLFSPVAVERLQKHYVNINLIVVLRNPVDRAYSDWWMNVCKGIEPLSFEKAVDLDFNRLNNGFSLESSYGYREWNRYLYNYIRQKLTHRFYVDRGYYNEQLKNVYKYYGKDQVKVLLFEDLCHAPAKTVNDLFRFCDLSSYDVDCDIYNKSFNSLTYARLVRLLVPLKVHRVLPKSVRDKILKRLKDISKRPTMDPSLENILVEHYKPYNEELADIIHRDLSHWNK